MSKVAFGFAFLATTILFWLMLTTVVGRWSRDKEPSKQHWTEMGLWNICICADNSETAACDTEKNFIRTAQAFSVISAILTALALLKLLYNFFLVKEQTKRFFCFLLFGTLLSFASSIITWTTFVGYFRKEDICTSGQPSLYDTGLLLDWAYGIRLVEFGGLAIASLCALILACGQPSFSSTSSLRYVMFTVLIAVGLCTIFTTAGRGWLKKDVGGDIWIEVGLFDTCQCLPAKDIPCKDLRDRLKACEAFAVVMLTLQFFVVMNTLREQGRPVVRILAILAWVPIGLVWYIFSSAFADDMCGSKLKDEAKLHWAYGLQIVAFGAQTVLIFATFIFRAAPAAAAVPAATAPDQPAAVAAEPKA